jgi:hypothetical protein
MNPIIENAPSMAVVIVVLGLLAYALALLLATFVGSKPGTLGAHLRAWFMSNPAQHIGIPCSAISAFAIVTVLLQVFKPAEGTDKAISFKAFGLVFSGPSGPITLWLLCFLAFVAALRLLRK